MAKSILQKDKSYCAMCGRNGAQDPLDEHHVFGGAYRQRSEADSLTIYLCHDRCHENGKRAVHRNAKIDRAIKKRAQQFAMKKFGWTVEEFRIYYGKNYL